MLERRALLIFVNADSNDSKEEGAHHHSDSAADDLASYAGVIMLLGYMVFDSYTSNFQAALFKEFKMSSYQMMFGVNLFSCIFTVWSLVQRGMFISSLQTVFYSPQLFIHVVGLSLCSATGQIFIFRTLSLYGALIFAIIMTT